VKKAQKANDHAQHEAAEACKRQQAAAEKAQKKIDDAYQQGNHEIDEANAKLNQRLSEWQDEYAKLNTLTATEATAGTQPLPADQQIERTKPEPAPIAPATTPSTLEAPQDR
jgi:hypothetical protein